MSFVVRPVQATGMTLSWFQRYGWKANIPYARQPVMTFRDFESFRRYRGLKSEVAEDGRPNVDFFGKKDPVRANYQKCFPKGFTVSQIHVLCANFVKFGRPEIIKVVRYLPDQKQKQKIGWRSRCRFYADRAQNLSGGQLQTICSEFKRATKCFQYSAKLLRRVII